MTRTWRQERADVVAWLQTVANYYQRRLGFAREADAVVLVMGRIRQGCHRQRRPKRRKQRA